MQYTGLRDRNGKEIYEGDILWSGSYSQNDGGKQVCSVEASDPYANRNADHWRIDMFTFKMHNGAGIYQFDNPSSWEVIGNVHENPELLNAS